MHCCSRPASWNIVSVLWCAINLVLLLKYIWQNSLFRCQTVHKLIVTQNSYFTCSNRQSRRDQWSSSQVTARGQRQLLRPYDQSPQAKSLQLRPSQSNFRCHNITEKSEYDIKNPTTAPAGPQLTNTGHADRAKQSLNHENKEKAKKLLQELIIVSDTDLLL